MPSTMEGGGCFDRRWKPRSCFCCVESSLACSVAVGVSFKALRAVHSRQNVCVALFSRKCHVERSVNQERKPSWKHDTKKATTTTKTWKNERLAVLAKTFQNDL